MIDTRVETKVESSGFKTTVQRFGRFLSGMVMPNIGAFIAWGLITALFIPTGWLPNESLSALVGPMILNLLPILIGYTGGKLVHDTRGGVVGAVATMGVVVGADIPMFIGAMLMGPLGGFTIKKFDEAVHGKIKPGFEMLVNNFSAGILGMGLALLAFVGIGPVVLSLNNILEAAVQGIVTMGLLPLASIFIEPAKILFLNNAINHGVLGPLGIQEAKEIGKSIFFLLETNPGPGLGILLAYWAFSKGMIKQSAPGAIIIHFLGGIHEIYFPYVLMKPVLLLAVIAGGASGVFTFSLFNVGLVATPSPGSIFALMAMTPKGNFIGVLSGVVISTAVSFAVASFFLKKDGVKEASLEEAKNKVTSMKKASKGQVPIKSVDHVQKIVFACDAGMGSSAMGASSLRKKLRAAGVEVKVENSSVDAIPSDTDVIVTHEKLAARAKKALPSAEIITIKNFIGSPTYDQIVERFTEKNGLLVEENVRLNLRSEQKEDAITRVGKLLAAQGYVDVKYVESMLEREQVTSTYIGNGVAIPHGTNNSKKSIKQSGIAVLQYPDGVDFGGGNIAKLVIGIAGKDDEHLKILSNLAQVLEDEENADQMINASSGEMIVELLNKSS